MSEYNTHVEEHRDDEASKLGMWLFIFTELLLFGGLFLVYSIFRMQYPANFLGDAVMPAPHDIGVKVGATRSKGIDSRIQTQLDPLPGQNHDRV